MFLRQWDEEKYLNLGDFFYNNYQQALHIIEFDALALKDTLDSLNITVADLDQWENEEQAYIKTLGQEPEWDLHAVTNVELLQELRSLE